MKHQTVQPSIDKHRGTVLHQRTLQNSQSVRMHSVTRTITRFYVQSCAQRDTVNSVL